MADGSGMAPRRLRGKLLVALLIGLIGHVPVVAHAQQSSTNGSSASSSAPAKKKPTLEELEQRIELLENELAQQKQATDAARQSAASAQQLAASAQQSSAAAEQAATAAAQHPVVVQQATGTTEKQAQIYAGPGGFTIQSADGNNQIRFHGELDADGRFYTSGSVPIGSRDTWLISRARPIVEGTLGQIFDFRLNPDFGYGKTVIQDAFVAGRFDPLFVTTVGKFKEPFGLERLQLSPNNRFVYLGLPSDMVPNRDIGLQVSGHWKFSSGDLTYQVGYFDGVNDGSSTDANSTPDTDNNDQKDWVARMFAQPFSRTDSALKGLGVGAAVSYVSQVGSKTNSLLPTYHTETQLAFFSYDPTPVTNVGTGGSSGGSTGTGNAVAPTYADGNRLRISPQAFYYYKRFGLLAEYVDETQGIARSLGPGTKSVTRRADVKPESWQVYSTFLLTGEDAAFDTIKPLRPFALGQPGWGAFEVAARYSQLKLDTAAFSLQNGVPGTYFANPDTQAREATAWTAGINWYLDQNITWFLNYTDTSFQGGAPNGANKSHESAVFTQFQVAF